MKDRNERKLFTSMGPWHIYMKLSLLTFYTPYWRKICRMLCQMRRMNRIDFKGECRRRTFKYAQAAMRDTKLPDMLKFALSQAIIDEFNFDPRKGGKEVCIIGK